MRREREPKLARMGGEGNLRRDKWVLLAREGEASREPLSPAKHCCRRFCVLGCKVDIWRRVFPRVKPYVRQERRHVIPFSILVLFRLHKAPPLRERN